jgi:putative hemolysin
MKRFTVLMWLSAAALVLAGCASGGEGAAPSGQKVAAANPASVFCVERGGKVVIRKDGGGSEHGVCVWDNGSEIDEWEYYRKHHK